MLDISIRPQRETSGRNDRKDIGCFEIESYHWSLRSFKYDSELRSFL